MRVYSEEKMARKKQKQDNCHIETVSITKTNPVTKPYHARADDTITSTISSMSKTFTDRQGQDTENNA